MSSIKMLNVASVLGCQGPGSQTACPNSNAQQPGTRHSPRAKENDMPDADAACRLTCTGRLEVAVGWWQWHCRQITFSFYSVSKDTSAALALKMVWGPRGFRIAAEGAQVFAALPWGSFVWVSTAQDKNRASKMNHGRPLSQFYSCFANVQILALTAFIFLKSQWQRLYKASIKQFNLQKFTSFAAD